MKMTEKEIIRAKVAELIYARVGWSDASEGASVDIAHFLLEDRKAILDRITEPLRAIKASYKNGITAFSYQDAIDQVINLADEMTKGTE